MCYEDDQDLFNAIASDCSPLTAAGFPVICTPTTTGFNLRVYHDSTSYTDSAISPALISCAYEIDTAMELGWLVVGMFCAGFAIMMLRRVLR